MTKGAGALAETQDSASGGEISTETEIHIAPDGRVFVFGLSKQVLEVLSGLCPGDRALQRRCAATTTSLAGRSEP